MPRSRYAISSSQGPPASDSRQRRPVPLETVWLVFRQAPRASNSRNRVITVSAGTSTIYEDRTVRLDDQGVTIRHYYFPFVSKFVPYSQIESVDLGVMSWLSGRLRIWGNNRFQFVVQPGSVTPVEGDRCGTHPHRPRDALIQSQRPQSRRRRNPKSHWIAHPELTVIRQRPIPSKNAV